MHTFLDCEPGRAQDRPEHGISKQDYIEAVLAGLHSYQRAAHGASNLCPERATQLDINWLLSIDRRESAAQAMQTVRLPCAKVLAHRYADSEGACAH